MTSFWIAPATSVVVAPDILTRAVEGYLVLYNPRNDHISHLDPVGSIVWSLIEEPCRLGDLSDELARIFHVEAGVVISDLAKLLAGLLDAGAVHLRPE